MGGINDNDQRENPLHTSNGVFECSAVSIVLVSDTLFSHRHCTSTKTTHHTTWSSDTRNSSAHSVSLDGINAY